MHYALHIVGAQPVSINNNIIIRSLLLLLILCQVGRCGGGGIGVQQHCSLCPFQAV